MTLVRAGGAAVFAALAVEPALLAGRRRLGRLRRRGRLLALDGLDGWAARGARASPRRFGARFDMEVDALLILALAALAAGLGKAGPWVLGLGLMRYGFVLAGWLAAGAGAAAAAVAAPPRGLRGAGGGARPPARPAGRPALVRPLLAARRLRRAGRSFAIDVAWLLRRAPMTADLRTWAGLARSLVIYRARPWRSPAGAVLPRHRRPRRSRLRHRRPCRQPHPRAARAPAPGSSRSSRSGPSTPSCSATCRPRSRLLPVAAGRAPGPGPARGLPPAPDRLLARRGLRRAGCGRAGLRRACAGTPPRPSRSPRSTR